MSGETDVGGAGGAIEIDVGRIFEYTAKHGWRDLGDEVPKAVVDAANERGTLFARDQDYETREWHALSCPAGNLAEPPIWRVFSASGDDGMHDFLVVFEQDLTPTVVCCPRLPDLVALLRELAPMRPRITAPIPAPPDTVVDGAPVVGFRFDDGVPRAIFLEEVLSDTYASGMRRRRGDRA